MTPNMLIWPTLSNLDSSVDIKTAGKIFVYSDGGYFDLGCLRKCSGRNILAVFRSFTSIFI